MIKLTTGFLLISSLVSSLAIADSRRFHPGHLLIKMKEGQSLGASPHIQRSKHLIGDIYLLQTNNLEVLKRDLSGNIQVESVQKDYYGTKNKKHKHEMLDPLRQYLNAELPENFNFFNDPQVNKLWAFNKISGMNVTGAYATLPPYTPEEVIVAVVDTGVEHTHEDLKDVMWVNPGEIPGDGIDNDKNGYIDDIHGINTLVRDSNGRPTMNTLPADVPFGGGYHGTHVSGTIAATQNNSVGIAGVANNVKIMAIRTVPDEGDELDSDIIESFTYAAKNGAKVINCSFGKAVNEGGMIVNEVMSEIGKKYGVLIVAAAGNSSENIDSIPAYPASFNVSNMIVVAATNIEAELAYYSNTGKMNVDVAAPGSGILSTMTHNKYGYLDGTSMAAPNVAGAAAMILGYFPNLTPNDVKKVLIKSVTKQDDLKDQVLSGGRVNLEAALRKAANF